MGGGGGGGGHREINLALRLSAVSAAEITDPARVSGQLVCKSTRTLVHLYLTRNGPAQARVMMKSVLSSAEHGRCPHKY